MIYRSRFFVVAFLLSFVGIVSSGNAANVPITDSMGGILGTERNTCDPAFYDVLSNRAHMEAQREVTQTQNLIARPDSVLAMSCFKQFLDHQSWYANNFFPGNPQESQGGFGGIFNDLATRLIDRLVSSGDPSLTQGYTMFAVLEILVLDQLTDVDSIIGTVSDGVKLFPCTSKEYYIDDNFPDFLLGDRAVRIGGYNEVEYGARRYQLIGPPGPNYAGPDYDEIDDGITPSSNPPSYDCRVMNDVWTRAKCYDFATESGLSGYASAVDHDGFYTLLDYVSEAAAGRDYREHVTQCEPPDGNLFDPPSISDLLCYARLHGLIPGLPPVSIAATRAASSLSTPSQRYDIISDNPTWADVDAAVNVAPGGAGAVHQYRTYSDTLTGSCSPPIQTGFLVYGFNNRTYIDAICPEPACYFDPPTTTGSLGSCIAP